MAIVTVGIDLAKNVFAVHGVGESGKSELVRPEVPRAKLLELITGFPPCLIGMEACSGAHHWARDGFVPPNVRVAFSGKLLPPTLLAQTLVADKPAVTSHWTTAWCWPPPSQTPRASLPF
jgi:hypothetical protein